MSINALSYIGVNSDKIEDWKDFATKNLGMQKTDYSKKSLFFRGPLKNKRFRGSGSATSRNRAELTKTKNSAP